MATTIYRRQQNGVTILDLNGRITLGEGSDQLRRAVREETANGSRNFLLDMADVTTIDSSGIGELVSSYTTTQREGGRVKLLKLPPKINTLLQITQLITIFDTYDDENEAVASF
jgi:anti-anti-sigma factor